MAEGIRRSAKLPFPSAAAEPRAIEETAITPFASIPESRLLEVLREVATVNARAGIPFAVVGGVAMVVHGRPRATKDLDILIRGEDRDRVEPALGLIGFAPAIATAGYTRFVRHPLPSLPELTEWVDVLYARTVFGKELITHAQQKPARWGGLELGVVSVEGLVVMKLIALAEDPTRLHDRADLGALLGMEPNPVNRDRVLELATKVGADIVDLWSRIARESDDAKRNRGTEYDSPNRL